MGGIYSIIGMKPDLWWKSNSNIAYKKSNEYDDSRFFADSEKAFAYFIDKTANMINN